MARAHPVIVVRPAGVTVLCGGLGLLVGAIEVLGVAVVVSRTYVP